MQNKTKKKTDIPMPIFASIIIAFIFYMLFAMQRVQVLLETEADVDMIELVTDPAGIKYLLGLSYSAEEMEALLNFRAKFQDLESKFRSL